MTKIQEDINKSLVQGSRPQRSNNIQYVKGVGPKRAKLLEKLDIYTIEDALFFLPRRYEDRSNLKPISKLKAGEVQTFLGNILASGVLTTKRRKRIYELIIGDNSGTIRIKWFRFNENYMKKRYKTDQKVIVSGNVQYNNYYGHQKEMYHPEIEMLGSEDEYEFLHVGRIVPIYHTTEGVHQKEMRTIMKSVVDNYIHTVAETIPEYILEREKLIPVTDAIRLSHFPDSGTSVDMLNLYKSPPQKRLIFEELLLLELGLAMKKINIKKEKKKICYEYKKDVLNDLVKRLPFKLTQAQISAAKDILDDLLKPYPMNRLLQGDVGSGKTVVAVISVMLAIANGNQAAIMAPTEILAEQHYTRITRLLEGLNISAVLLTSNTKPKEKEEILRRIEAGSAHIIIGTHALIQEEVQFYRLSLTVIDEQHKFGVMQRAYLKKKGYNPDVLVMTATPIPRTLAMTVYGDLDISVIDELPAGRKPVKTFVYYEKRKMDAYNLLRSEIKKGRQGYIVFPIVEESEKLDLKSAKEGFQYFKEELFADMRLGLLHGRLKRDEKEDIMNGFHNGDIDIIIATTVVEVGIDVQNASIMLVEHAERFGLAQLHQLRGRIGRSKYQSYCVLIPIFPVSDDAKKRLQVMKESSDGFYISEKDLEIRGPGEFFGTRQSGLPELKLANIIRDSKMLEHTKKIAFDLISADPDLSNKENESLKKAVIEKWEKRLELMNVG